MTLVGITELHARIMVKRPVSNSKQRPRDSYRFRERWQGQGAVCLLKKELVLFSFLPLDPTFGKKKLWIGRYLWPLADVSSTSAGKWYQRFLFPVSSQVHISLFPQGTEQMSLQYVEGHRTKQQRVATRLPESRLAHSLLAFIKVFGYLGGTGTNGARVTSRLVAGVCTLSIRNNNCSLMMLFS